MAFKDYTNPMYDVVADENDWTSGLCCIFANALQERFGLGMRALMVVSREAPSNKTLIHAFGVLPDGRIVDANGIRAESALLAEDYADATDRTWRYLHCAQPEEVIDIVIEPVTLDHLWALNPEDHEATNAAHDFIDKHSELFAELQQLRQRPKMRAR